MALEMVQEKDLVDAAGLAAGHLSDNVVKASDKNGDIPGVDFSASASTSDIIDMPKSSTTTAQKANDILDACNQRDIRHLRALAESEGGFLNDGLRRLAWPLLLGFSPTASVVEGDDSKASNATGLGNNWRDLPRHKDEDQVQLDVNRSFIYYPNDESEADLSKRKNELSCLIAEVLRRHPFLCYFQGYHDICQVFLLVLEPATTAHVVARLSVLKIRDFMLPNLGPTTAQLRLLPDVLAHADPELRRHIANIEPFYALAGTLTMYAHNIEQYKDIARLFDVILAREPVFPIYMFAQIIIDRRDEILDIDEYDMLQVILGRVPPNIDLDSLIKRSVSLLNQTPPETLRSWNQISSSSVLKTAGGIDSCSRQSMEEGHRYFEKQASEIQWSDMKDKFRMMAWAYRGRIGTAGMAVLVGVAAVYLRRNPALIQSILSYQFC